jgi:hypothetical protein
MDLYSIRGQDTVLLTATFPVNRLPLVWASASDEYAGSKFDWAAQALIGLSNGGLRLSSSGLGRRTRARQPARSYPCASPKFHAH